MRPDSASFENVPPLLLHGVREQPLCGLRKLWARASSICRRHQIGKRTAHAVAKIFREPGRARALRPVSARTSGDIATFPADCSSGPPASWLTGALRDRSIVERLGLLATTSAACRPSALLLGTIVPRKRILPGLASSMPVEVLAESAAVGPDPWSRRAWSPPSALRFGISHRQPALGSVGELLAC